jgi:hypothetical protein
MEVEARVLRLFRLTAPPIFFVLACYVFLGEHVFGLAYVLGKRVKPRMRAVLRAWYRVSTSSLAMGVHAYLLYACGGTASACPPVRMGERNCIAAVSVSALYCGATLLLERWANPFLHLQQPTGLRVRACSAAGLMVTWICIADKQLCAVLLLLLFTARRALALSQTLNYLYGLCMKCYTLIHMSRILTHECDGIPKLAVATVAAMTTL